VGNVWSQENRRKYWSWLFFSFVPASYLTPCKRSFYHGSSCDKQRGYLRKARQVKMCLKSWKIANQLPKFKQRANTWVCQPVELGQDWTRRVLPLWGQGHGVAGRLAGKIGWGRRRWLSLPWALWCAKWPARCPCHSVVVGNLGGVHRGVLSSPFFYFSFCLVKR